jgi:hypothetical protein
MMNVNEKVYISRSTNQDLIDSSWSYENTIEKCNNEQGLPERPIQFPIASSAIAAPSMYPIKFFLLESSCSVLAVFDLDAD